MKTILISNEERLTQLLTNKRDTVIGWLMHRYGVEYEIAADITSRAAEALLVRVKKNPAWADNPQVGLFIRTARNIYTHWLDKQNHLHIESFNENFDVHEDGVESDNGLIISLEKYNELMYAKMYWAIGQMTEKKQDFIKLYIDKYSMEEIAEMIGLKNRFVAKNMKYKIVKGLQELVKYAPCA